MHRNVGARPRRPHHDIVPRVTKMGALRLRCHLQLMATPGPNGRSSGLVQPPDRLEQTGEAYGRARTAGVEVLAVRKLVGALAAVGLSLTLAGPALATTPNHQACVGHDVSGYAAGGADFGHFVSGIASTTQGIGDEIQAHMAGQIPDTVLPNTCND